MKYIFTVIIFFSVFILSAQSQSFEISVDTININIRGRLNSSIKYRDKYYCFFETSNAPYSSKSSKHFYILSNAGRIMQEVNVPEEMNDTYYDLHVRNDSIITKTYSDHQSFFLDTAKREWVKIKEVDDLVFEDDKFYITYLDFGEWGGTVWFRDKKTGLEYEVKSSEPTINKLNNIYYLTTGKRLLVIDDPLKMKMCDRGYYYRIVEKRKGNEFFEGSQSVAGTKTLFQDTTSDWSSHFYIATSFISDNQIFHICVDSSITYIATLVNGKINPVQTIGNVSVYDNYYSYRCKSVNDQVLKFDTKCDNLFGYIEINGNKIRINYFKNESSEKFLGTVNAEHDFNALFDFIYKQMGSLSLNKVDSVEQLMNSTDLTQSHKISIGTHYYPNKNLYKLETPRIYKKIEDSTFTVFSNYYYTKHNGSIKVIFIEWSETSLGINDLFLSADQSQSKSFLFQNKFDKVATYITNTVGHPQKKSKNSKGENVIWQTQNGLTINLDGSDFDKYRNIRLIIYKE
jgi:hypothetical protein